MTTLLEPLEVRYISNNDEISSKVIENYTTGWFDNDLVGHACPDDKWGIYKSENLWICADVSGKYTPSEPITVLKKYFNTFDEAIMYGLTLL